MFHTFLLFILLPSYVSSAIMELYVKYNETNVHCLEKELPSCGSFEKPMESLLQAFYYIDMNSKEIEKTYDHIKVLLVSEDYVIDPPNATYYLNKLNSFYGSKDGIWKVFGHFTAGNLSFELIGVGDLNKVSIHFRTFLVSFQVNFSYFSFSNLSFFGYDFLLVSSTGKSCMYWKLACCSCCKDCKSIIQTSILVGAIVFYHIFEVNTLRSVFNLIKCDFFYFEFRKAYSSGGVVYTLNGFLLVKATQVFIFVKDCIFQNILYRNYLFGTSESESKYFSLYLSRNLTIENSSIIEINCDAKSLSTSNATFEFRNMGFIKFANCDFNTVRYFFNAANLYDLSVINCKFSYFINSNNIESVRDGAIITVNTIFTKMDNCYFEGNFLSSKILYITSSMTSILNLRMVNLNFTDEPPLFFIGLIAKVLLKNVFISLLCENRLICNALLFSQYSEILLENCTFINLNKGTILIFNFNLDYIPIRKNLGLEPTSFLFLLIKDVKANEKNFLYGKIQFNFVNGTRNLIIIHNFIGIKASLAFRQNNNVTISQSSFYSNSDFMINTIVADSFNIIIFKSCSFSSVISNTKGTALNLATYNSIVLINCTFKELKNFESASILFAVSFNAIKFFNSFLFSLETSDSGGGCLFVNNNILIIRNSWAKNYSAINSGGFLYAIQSKNMISIENSTFENGYAADGGCFFLNYQSFLFICNSNFINNSAGFDGGTFKLNVQITVYFTHAQIINSLSRELSGSISIFQQNKIKINFSEFRNSLANTAGVFSLKFDNYFILVNSSINFVKARELAGCFKIVDHNIIKVSFTFFQEIFSQNSGGILTLDTNNKIFILNSNFVNSFSDQDAFLIQNSNYFLCISSIFNFKREKIISRFLNVQGSFNSIFLFNIKKFDVSLRSLLYLENENQIRLDSIYFKNIVIQDYLIISKFKNILLLSNMNIISSNPEKNIIFKMERSFLILKNSNFLSKDNNKILFGILNISKAFFINNKIINQKKILSDEIPLNYGFVSYSSLIRFHKTFVTQKDFYFYSSYIIFSVFTSIIGRDSVAITFLPTNDKEYCSKLNLKIIKSIFSHLKGNILGGVVYFGNQKDNMNKLIIEKSIFSYNRAIHGSVLHIVNLNTLIVRRSKFFLNFAVSDVPNNIISKGGVFYFRTDFNFSKFLIEQNQINSNKAFIGGVFYIKSGFPFLNKNEILKKNFVKNNVAFSYGQDFSTFPFLITSHTDEVVKAENSYLKITNLVSGKNYEYCLGMIYFFDGYDNLALNNEISDLNSNSKNNFNFDIMSLKNIRIEKGQICFYGLLKLNSTNTTQSYVLNIMFTYSTRNLIIKSSKVNIFYYYRPCTKGETMDSTFNCIECPRSFYSFQTKVDISTSCVACGEDLAFNCFGGNNITIKSGYWRSSYSSTKILACPNSYSCIGDTRNFQVGTQYEDRYAIQRCMKGYIDPLCAVCEKGYGIYDRYFCLKCDTLDYLYRSLVFFLFQILICTYTIYKSFIISINFCDQKLDYKNIIATTLLKLCLSHSQMLLVLFSKKGGWKTFVFSIFDKSPFNSNFSDSLSLQCLFELLNYNIPYIYSKILVSLTTPIVIFVLAVIYLKIYLHLSKNKIRQNRLSKIYKKIGEFSMIQGLFYIIFTIQNSNVIRDCFNMFLFTNIEDETREKDLRLVLDYAVQYESSIHYKMRNFLSLPAIIIVGILFPVFIFFRVYFKKRNDNLQTPHNLFVYGYFFYPYKDKFYFWDMVSAAQKFVVQGIVVLSLDFDDEQAIKTTIVILMFFVISTFFLLKIKPYKKEFNVLNIAAGKSYLTLTLSTIIMIPLVEKNMEFQFKEDLFFFILLIFFFLLNGGFFIYTVSVYFKNLNFYKKILSFAKIIDSKLFFKKYSNKILEKSNVKQSSQLTLSSKFFNSANSNKIKSSSIVNENFGVESQMNSKFSKSREIEFSVYLKRKNHKFDSLLKFVKNNRMKQKQFQNYKKYEDKFGTDFLTLCFEREDTICFFENEFFIMKLYFNFSEYQKPINFEIAINFFNSNVTEIISKILFKENPNKCNNCNDKITVFS